MKTYIITGAGTGIGKATAELLANQGNQIILIGRTEKKIKIVLDSLPSDMPHMIFTADVTKLDELIDIAHNLNHLSIDGVFANAGIGGENHSGENDRWHEIVNVNLTGSYNTATAFLPLLKRNKTGFKNIIFTSSCLARFGVPNYTAYCASKAGLLGLTKSLALTHAKDKILVNSICPGWVETEMAVAGIKQYAEHEGRSYTQELAKQMSYVPLAKMSQPSEIAELVAWLFSDKQCSITGQAIDINNGAFMI